MSYIHMNSAVTLSRRLPYGNPFIASQRRLEHARHASLRQTSSLFSYCRRLSWSAALRHFRARDGIIDGRDPSYGSISNLGEKGIKLSIKDDRRNVVTSFYHEGNVTRRGLHPA